MMTSFAFILGVVPLVIAEGAGAEMRRSLGTAVFSGMLGVTLFGIFLTPVFFYVIEWFGEIAVCSTARWIRRFGSGLVGARRGPGIGFLLGAGCRRGWAIGGGCWPAAGAGRARLLAPHRRRREIHLRVPSSDTRESTETTAVISHFFIDRPIFASVLSIVVTLAGAVAVFALPVAQYPDVTPPTVLVTALLSGRQRADRARHRGRAIEQQVSGVENMIYMSSQCTNDGAYMLTVTFKLGMDSDMAQVLVQNRVPLAQPVIPDLVQREGNQRQEDVAEHDDDRQPDLARRPLRQHLPEQLRHDPDQATSWAVCPASPTWPTWASAITACGPGSIPRSWPR